LSDIKIFGAAFDPLDLSERVDLKLAYLNWRKECDVNENQPADPYDFLKTRFENRVCQTGKVEWIGKFPIESWLRPKPSISDISNIVPQRFTEFLNKNGCYHYYERLVGYLKENVVSSVPIMIGVDHCLTGGALKFLSEQYDPLHIVIFDSHCDIVDLEFRRDYFGGDLKIEEQYLGGEIYECGSFLTSLLNAKIVRPENLWIMGTQDLDTLKENAGVLYSRKILPWIEQGVHIVSKEDLLLSGIPDEIRGPTYVSFDVDLGSLCSVFAARFLNYVGLNTKQILKLVDELSRRIRSKEIKLVGLDIMEIDIHFLGENIEGHQDHTPEIAHEIIDKIVYSNFC
jgi:arginase family enzyme